MSRGSIQVGTVASAALDHFATMLTIQRKEKKITVEDLCSRVGISKPTMIKILKGDPSVGIGLYFETAWVLGVSLFEPDESRFATKRKTNEKIEALLPNRVRREKVILDDNF
ncbi:helix-turn-helix domain-containing protein [Vibrio fluvialis]|uniref:helix-turn-helix domain-containing protein n=1 Tax=Vibrio fluvialis TaxID=676 RepID=UPI001EEAECD8|nr:helix-turn-helix transcriptional regulator [Vibrio fluvialis]MCG6357659.1 helix-turn-helix domain-containing protein [Vibrio fluvialis]